MRKARIPVEHFQQRRDALRERSDSAFVLFAAPEIKHVPYRQDSNFFYLTGFEEPGSVALIRPGKNPEFVLFVRPKDPSMELWDGFRFGVEGAQAEFGADQVYPVSELLQRAPALLKEVEKVYYRVGQSEVNDRLFKDLLESTRVSMGRSGRSLLAIHDPQEILGEMRVLKSPLEQEILRKATSISARDHRHVMKLTRSARSLLKTSFTFETSRT